MTRSADRWEGLAVEGAASVGPLRFPVPALIDHRPGGTAGPELVLSSEPSRPGVRHLRLAHGNDSVPLEFPVAAPEVAPSVPNVQAVGERVWSVHAPVPDLELDRVRAARPELVVLSNARALYSEGRPFVAALRQLRAVVGAEPLLWAPRVALPHRLPLLAYLGIDLVDTTEGRIATGRGVALDATFGEVDGPADTARPDRLEDEFRRSLAETRTALRLRRLRELVESRLTAEPAMSELLRYADRDLAGPLEERSPVAFVGSRSYVLAESHRRPEMVRFRRRLIERYRPPPSKAVLLLVPCSKTKPYRNSPSHRRIARALEGVQPLERLHIVSVSSPIGLVPRELEDVPPARHYDIPVTGEWTEEERRFVLEALAHLVSSGQYRSAIVHLDREEYGFLRDRFGDRLPVTWTLDGTRTTSGEGLKALRESVRAALEGVPAVAGGALAVVREELKEVSAVQFGREAAERLFAPPLRLAGRPWFQRLTDGTVDLATVREERGLFHLTVAGARRLAPEFPLAVRVDPSMALTGDLFVPGIVAADPGIRTGDSVVLLRGEALAGVGEAALPGPLMTQLTRGLAVKVRHREHARTDTAKSDEVGPPDGPVV